MKSGFRGKCQDTVYKDLTKIALGVSYNLYEHLELIFTIMESANLRLKNAIVCFSTIFPC